MITVPTLIKPTPEAEQPPAQRFKNTDEAHEYMMCSPIHGPAGFIRWCRNHAIIQDKETNAEIPFDPFPGQLRVIPPMVMGAWLILLKGRQLGMTLLAICYCLWRIAYSKFYTVCVINQDLPYARDFIRKIKWSYERLPAWSRNEITSDSEERLAFERGGQVAEIRAIAGSDRAARSFTGDLTIVDEASRVPCLKETMGAIIPSMRRSTRRAVDGQVIMLTTSAGATGDYADYWTETCGKHGELLDKQGVGPNGFMPFFIHWSERPGRDKKWFAARKRELDTISKVKVKQEYPDTPEEAFEYAEGRVFALFTRDRNVGDIVIPDNADRCRAIDWGDAGSAYVVLWIAHLNGPPGLLISEKCPNAIDEFIGYRLGDDGWPVKENDHTCDALRYAVVKHKFTGLVYVYREIYRKDSVERGWSMMKEIAEIHELSGWEPADPFDKRHYRPTRDAELFELQAVADRAQSKLILELNMYDIPCTASVPFRGPKSKDGRSRSGSRPELTQGIKMVCNLIDGSIDMDKYYEISREAEALRVYRDTLYDRYHATVGLEERKKLHLARELLKARRRRTREP